MPSVQQAGTIHSLNGLLKSTESSYEQRRLWSDCACAKVNLSHRQANVLLNRFSHNEIHRRGFMVMCFFPINAVSKLRLILCTSISSCWSAWSCWACINCDSRSRFLSKRALPNSAASCRSKIITEEGNPVKQAIFFSFHHLHIRILEAERQTDSRKEKLH